MIKNTIYICLLALLAISCDQKESFLYEDKDAIYFSLDSRANEKPWEQDQPESLTQEIDFAFRQTGKLDNHYQYPLYYGDSLRADTIRALVSVAGTISDQPREYYLKSVALADSVEMGEVEFFNPYRIEAGKITDTAVIVIKRPAARGVYGVAVTFDFEKSLAFENSIYGWNQYKFMISDRYPKPDGWSDEIYGEYSEEKYAFWVTVMQTTYEYRWVILDEYWMPLDPLDIVSILIEELDKYNAAHPGNPKPFDFPRSDD